MADPTIPILQPCLMYGLRTDISGNAHFITDEDILYPVGALLSVNNFTQKRQQFVKLPDKGLKTAQIILSPNLKLIAISERGDRPYIQLYDSSTLKKKRSLQIPAEKEVLTNEIVTYQFSFDSRLLVTVTGDPDWMMYAFNVDKGKLESSVRANNLNGTGTVNQVACNPNDVNLVVLVGAQVFKMMACSDSIWRQFGYSKSENLNLTSAAWMTQDRLLVGSAEGKFMVFESGELKAIYWAGDLPVLSLKTKEKEEMQQSSQTNISEPSAGSFHMDEDYEIRNLIIFPRGLVFTYLKGTIHLYEKQTVTKYTKRNVFRIPDHNIIREETDTDNALNEINCLDINPSQDRLLVTCKENQLYDVKLWGADYNTVGEVICRELGPSLHHGPIGGMDVCTWKPIFITTGEWDKTVRVWNYDTETLELCKQFQEDIHGIALHPTGLHTVVGFSDKLRFMSIMIDDFVIIKEFPIRNCRECAFSSMGHFFAATNGNLIQVYCSITFDNLFNLKGHSGRVRSMSWTKDDYKMTSCGSEGAVYDWDVVTTKRVAETIIKTCSFSGVATTKDGKSAYAVGSDGFIREVIDSDIHREVVVVESGLDTLALSHSDQMLFVTGNQGVVYSVKLPILDYAEYLEFAGHSTTVTRMAITHDDKYLITCSADAVICVWRLLNTEGKTAKIDKSLISSTDILISREDLEEKMDTIKDLQVRMHELVTEHSYQMRNVEAIHVMKMKDVHEGYCAAIEELKEKNETLESEHAQEISNMTVETNVIRQKHDEFIQQLEVNYNDKLIIEYDKYYQLEDKLSNMRMRYETELEELRTAKQKSEDSITNNFIQKLQDKDVEIEELLGESKSKTKEHELIKQQIEDDADREIYELKSFHEKELKEEQDNNVRLRGETGLIRKKLIASQKEIDELKHSVYTLQNEHIKFKGVIVGLEKDISDLKKEISERDATIQDKERRIYELKRKNQELEKFKFILDFKIKELKSQIEPRDRQIQEQTEQINDMVNELENLQKVILSLDIQLGELREKLSAADNEIKREVAKNRTAKAALKTIRTDIHQMSGLVQDIPKLTRAVKAMYHKYNADKDFELTQAEDTEAKNEFLRQRDFLERTVKSLQQQVTKNYSSGGTDKSRLVDENTILVEETNALRKNLKYEVIQNQKLESLLGLSSKYMKAKQAQKKLNDAVATTDAIHEEYHQRLESDENAILALREENNRLISKIIKEEENEEVFIQEEALEEAEAEAESNN